MVMLILRLLRANEVSDSDNIIFGMNVGDADDVNMLREAESVVLY